MTAPGQKTKKKKKRRAHRGSRDYYVRGKSGRHSCGLCGGLLHGVPHGKGVSGVRKESKTEKRPSAPFGGVLCGKCRRIVAVEKASLENGLKAAEGVDLKVRRFIAGVEE
jgi:ribosomal protein L34E